MDTQSRAADIWRDALIFYLKINAHVCRPSFSQSCGEMESTCHLAAVVFASQTSSIIKSAEDVPRQAERKRLYNGVTRAARAVRRISTNSRKSQAQSLPPVHSKQTGDTFHHSLKLDTRVSLTTTGWMGSGHGGGMHASGVCVYVWEMC